MLEIMNCVALLITIFKMQSVILAKRTVDVLFKDALKE